MTKPFTPLHIGEEIKILECSRNILGVATGLVFQTRNGIELYVDYCSEEGFKRMLLYTIAKKGYPVNVEGCAGMNGAKPCIFHSGRKEY